MAFEALKMFWGDALLIVMRSWNCDWFELDWDSQVSMLYIYDTIKYHMLEKLGHEVETIKQQQEYYCKH